MKCLHKVYGIKQNTMQPVMYADRVHNGAGHSVVQAVNRLRQVGDVSAV